MKQSQTIHLGYEVGTGKPVEIPVKHMAVTGQTQEAGKTTAMEALIERSGRRAIVFITKRGERSFAGGRRLEPYFRERADWVFVSSLIDATLQEKNKLLRAWLMKVCRNTRTLAEVHRNVREAKDKARGFAESIYTEIDGYLELVVPQLAELPPTSGVKLGPGLNVMDLSPYSSELQGLVIRSVIEWVHERENDVITVIPEAWEFLPEGRGSPVKQAVEQLIRKGAGLGNRVWVDSQDLAGVWKLAVRASAVCLIGVQREANEIKRTLANIPGNIAKPRANDIASLELGQFYACWGNHVIRTYVQPVWMGAEDAKAVAMGTLHVSDVARVPLPRPAAPIQHQPAKPAKPEGVKPVSTTDQKLDRLIELMSRQQQEAPVSAAPPSPPPLEVGRFVMAAGSDATVTQGEEIYQYVKKRLLAELPALSAGQIVVSPPEKLQKDFQKQEADRLVAAARELRPIQKRVLKLLQTTDAVIKQTTIAQRLGRPTSGGSWTDMGAAIKGLAALGFVETKGGVGTRNNLRQKIAADLAFYKPSEAEVDATYHAVMYQLATESEG
jgi:hypothetical protein